jgi:UDP-N-acetylglucosamine 2-epimerase
MPTTKVMFSPRFGFRWFTDDSHRTLLRGGVGLFTGRVPFVWLSNAYSNTGVEIIGTTINNASDIPAVTGNTSELVEYLSKGSAARPDIVTVNRKFRYPQVLRANLAAIESSDILTRLGLTSKGYILLSAHREENIDDEANFNALFTAVNRLAAHYGMPILYPCHPRARKRLETSGFALDPRVMLHEPLGFFDYNHLQMNAFCVVSDSGTLPEEASFYTSIGRPYPAVSIRTSTERPEAMEKACFTLAGIREDSLLQAVETAVSLIQNGDRGTPVPAYTDEDVSTKVIRIIQSYTPVVNRNVWRKF